MRCKVFKKCGGCRYPHADYPAYLEAQQRKLGQLLAVYAPVQPIIPMDHPFYYRNKVQAVVSWSAGKVITGNYKEESHRVVAVDHCLIENQLAQQIIHSVRKLIPSFKWRVYDEDLGRGLIRHILVRTSRDSREALLVLVMAEHMIPGKANFVKAIRKKHPEIQGVVFNLNNRQTSMVLGPRNISVRGRDHLRDELLGKQFRISAGSFYQVNPIQTERLYETAIRLAELKPTDRVIDAYSGIGTIALSIADQVKQVYAVELNREAVADAIQNARINNISNVQFFAADATQWIYQQAPKQGIDCLIVDPPRFGCDPEFLAAVNKLAPERMVYISCNPETLARDLKLLQAKYKVNTIQPVDMFCWTDHVETIVLLQRADT